MACPSGAPDRGSGIEERAGLSVATPDPSICLSGRTTRAINETPILGVDVYWLIACPPIYSLPLSYQQAAII